MIRPRRERADPPPEWLPPSGQRNTAYLVQGTRGAVASEDETCSNLGLDVLKVSAYH